MSQRSLTLASNVRQQLATLLEKLHVDCSVSCWPEKEPFLKCLLAGLSLNVAQKVSSIMTQDKKGSNVTSAVGGSGKSFSFSNTNNNNNNANLQAVFANNDPLAPYRTVRGNQPVHIHPSSVLFSMINSKKLPAFVVYADLLTTSKQYMRNVSIVEGDWLTELFPNSFKK